MPITPASGAGSSPRSGSSAQSLANMRNLSRALQKGRGGTGSSGVRFTKGYVAAIDGNNPTQTVSIYIDGDTSTLIPGVTFADSYHNPMVGDVVIAVKQGADVLILDRYTVGGGCLVHTLLGVNSTILVNVPPSNYNHLRVYFVGGSVSTTGNGFDDLIVQFNGDTGNNYSRHYGFAVNSTSWTVGSAAAGAFIIAGHVQSAHVPGSGGGFSVMEIPMYQRASLSKQLTFHTHASSGIGAPNNFQFGTGGGIWGNSTAAITSILIGSATSPGTLEAGSEVYVYGV